MPYAHDGSSGVSKPSRRGRRGRPKKPSTTGGTTPTYSGGSSSSGSSIGTAAKSSSNSSSSANSASSLQQQYLAAQRKAQAKADAKAKAEQRAAEDKAAKKARDESIRQNKVTRAQADAQFRLLGKYDDARDLKLGNISRAMATADKALMKAYKATSGQLVGARSDNEKAEGSTSFGNTANRLRESGDLLAETSSMGAGESDTMRAQLQAVRNWDANQQEVNRSFFDTLRTVNSSITDLNNDTRTSRINLREQAYSDKEQVWSNYYDRMADTWTQIYNIEGSNANLGAKNTAKKGTAEYENPIQAYERKYGNAAKNAARAAGSGYKNPGISKALQNWTGTVKAKGAKLTNASMAAAVRTPMLKKPEGATLRYVDAPDRPVTPLPGPGRPDVTWPGHPIKVPVKGPAKGGRTLAASVVDPSDRKAPALQAGLPSNRAAVQPRVTAATPGIARPAAGSLLSEEQLRRESASRLGGSKAPAVLANWSNR